MRSTVAAETTLPPVPLECGTGFLLPLASLRLYGVLNKRLVERGYIVFGQTAQLQFDAIVLSKT